MFNLLNSGWLYIFNHALCICIYSLTPTYAIALLIYWQLMPYFADGPLWMALYDDKQCDHYWWTNLLYINNFHPDYSNMVSNMDRDFEIKLYEFLCYCCCHVCILCM